MSTTSKSDKYPLVSCIVTTHNRLDLLKRAVESIKRQTYPNIEIIVVDDASDDGTREWGEKEDIKYLRISKEDSKGGNYARNTGIQLSKGEYCAFLDDDDYWLSEKIQDQVELAKIRDADFVYCGRRLEIIEKNGSIRYIDQIPKEYYSGDLSNKILFSIPTTTSLMLVKKNTLLKIGCFDENLKFWQDYDLMIRLAQRTPIYFVPKVLAVYRLSQQDKNRLTNKFDGWLTAVGYIRHKYHNLYDQLNFWQNIKVKIFIANDAKQRVRHTSKLLYLKYCILSQLGKLYLLIDSILKGEFDRIFNRLKRILHI